MLKEKVRAELERKPFVPLRIHLKNGKRHDIPFPEVARMLGFGVLVFIGMKEGTRQAKAYDRFPFDHIIRIEHRPGRTSGKRRKAS